MFTDEVEVIGACLHEVGGRGIRLGVPVGREQEKRFPLRRRQGSHTKRILGLRETQAGSFVGERPGVGGQGDVDGSIFIDEQNVAVTDLSDEQEVRRRHRGQERRAILPERRIAAFRLGADPLLPFPNDLGAKGVFGVLPDLDRTRSVFLQVLGEPHERRKGHLNRKPGADIGILARTVAVGNGQGHNVGNHYPPCFVLAGLAGPEVVRADHALSGTRGPPARSRSRLATTRRHWRPTGRAVGVAARCPRPAHPPPGSPGRKRPEGPRWTPSGCN